MPGDEDGSSENYFSRYLAHTATRTGLRDDFRGISGVGYEIQWRLWSAGYRTIEDLEDAEQSELAEVDGVGNALAARILADLHEPPVDVDVDAESLLEEVEETENSNRSNPIPRYYPPR